jgi:hypothetical protein
MRANGNDADFFLELWPGARDRDGLPDSIRFWKSRIEEMDGDNTFVRGFDMQNPRRPIRKRTQNIVEGAVMCVKQQKMALEEIVAVGAERGVG